jgi:hypothetical protein
MRNLVGVAAIILAVTLIGLAVLLTSRLQPAAPPPAVTSSKSEEDELLERIRNHPWFSPID